MSAAHFNDERYWAGGASIYFAMETEFIPPSLRDCERGSAVSKHLCMSGPASLIGLHLHIMAAPRPVHPLPQCCCLPLSSFCSTCFMQAAHNSVCVCEYNKIFLIYTTSTTGIKIYMRKLANVYSYTISLTHNIHTRVL